MYDVCNFVLSKILREYQNEKIVDLIKYNVKGKRMRYRIFEDMLKRLGNSSETDLYRGFFIEILHSSYVILDDIADNSSVRRGNPCYYLKRGMSAMKDGFFLISLVYKILNYKQHNSYISHEDTLIVNDTFFFTCVSQSLDVLEKKRDLYSFKNYKFICDGKTSVYTFYLPMLYAYRMNNLVIPNNLKKFSEICGLIGQMQDDYLNFHSEICDKSCNDLTEKKLTFFTSLLSQLECDVVEEYFTLGKTTESLMNIVQTFFSVYHEYIKVLFKSAEDMVDLLCTRIVVDILESRNIK